MASEMRRKFNFRKPEKNSSRNKNIKKCNNEAKQMKLYPFKACIKGNRNEK